MKKPKQSQKNNLIVWIILGVLLLGLGGAGAFLMLSNRNSNDSATELEVSIDVPVDHSGIDWSNSEIRSFELSESFKITQPGVYILTGKIASGNIEVDTKGAVKLVFNNLEVHNSNGPVINIVSAEKVVLTSAKDTQNVLSDGGNYATASGAKIDGAVYSAAELWFEGDGTLEISGNSNHAIVSKATITIAAGSYNISAAQDTINGKTDIQVSGGDITLSAGDDGIHSDATLTIDGGKILITESCEGLEGADIVINDGEITLKSSDDGINVASSEDTSQNNFGGPMAVGTGTLTINGGKITVDASGDGLDANGSIYINGGDIIVAGPTSGADGALDYDGELKITGGTLLAIGSSQMAQGISSSSTQYGLMANLTGTYSAGSKIQITSSDGAELITFNTTKNFNSIVFSSNKLQNGQTYSVKIDGQEVASATLSQIMTTIGTTSFGGGGGSMQTPMNRPDDAGGFSGGEGMFGPRR